MPAHRLTLFALLAACGSQTASAPPPEAAPPAAEEEAAEAGENVTIGDRMWHHFWDATKAREAIIAGDLEGARPPLKRIADGEYGEEIGEAWMPWVKDMQLAADKGVDAKTLKQAAQAVAEVGHTCAECHRTTTGGPNFEDDHAVYDHGGKTGLEEHMARHLFSERELWLGMSGPVHQAWSRGASALMNISVPKLVTHQGVPAEEDKAPTGDGTVEGEGALPQPEIKSSEAISPGGADLDVALKEMRDLGRRADTAAIPKEKQRIYAEILARCGSCHQHLGLKFERSHPAP